MRDTTRVVTGAVIAGLIARSRCRRGHALTNVVVPDWYECDIAAVEAATGCLSEFEVKVTRSDFARDGGKVEKRNRLLAGDPTGPAKFWYVWPHGLVDIGLVPSWAGVIEIGVKEGKLVEAVTKSAPQLHREPASQLVRDHLIRAAFVRANKSGIDAGLESVS